MNIYYCDSCGEIIQSADDAPQAGGQTLCASCRSGGSQQSTSSGSAAARPTDAAELGAVQDLNMASMLQSSDLDLFSSDTIARRKGGGKRAGSSLKIIDEAGAATRPAPRSPQDTASKVNLSPVCPNPGADPLGRVGGSGSATAVGSPPATPGTPSRSPSSVVGSASLQSGSAAVRGDKWRLACLACGARLAIKPVGRRSRLRCPKCAVAMVVSPDGGIEVSDNPSPTGSSPRLAHFDSGSSVVAGGGRGARPGSVATPVRAPGSAAVAGGAAPLPQGVDQVLSSVGDSIAEEFRNAPPGGTGSAGLRSGSSALASGAGAGGGAHAATRPSSTARDTDTPLSETFASPPASVLRPLETALTRRAHLATTIFWLSAATLPAAAGLLLGSDLVPETWRSALHPLGELARQAVDRLFELLP